MTNNHQGVLIEVRYALERYTHFKTNEGQDAIGKKALERLDAFLADVPEGLGEALKGEDVHRHIDKQTLGNAALILHTATTKGQE